MQAKHRKTSAASASAADPSSLLLVDEADVRRQLHRTQDAPFAHAIVDGAVDASELLIVRDELLRGIDAGASDDDLHDYLVADLSELPSTLNCTQGLRDALCGEEFRSLVSRAAGIPLEGTVDMHALCLATGQHVLCHSCCDEPQPPPAGHVNSRRLAFALYLIDEAEEWKAADGGALELFGRDATGLPTTADVQVLPKFNRLVLWDADAGRNALPYHAIAPVVAEHKALVLLRGFLHGPGPEPPAAQPMPPPMAPFRDLRDRPVRTAPSATLEHVFFAASKEFDTSCCVVIDDFFAELPRAGFDNGRWEPAGPPNLRRYHRLAKGVEGVEGANPLERVRAMLESRHTVEMLESLSGESITGVVAEARKFAPGDYTLCYDEAAAKGHVLDVCVTCVAGGGEEGGEGGEEGEGALLRWAADEEPELLAVRPAHNRFVVAMREPGTFVYVACTPKSDSKPVVCARYDVFATYALAHRSSDDDSE